MNYCRFNKHRDNIQLDHRIVLTCAERFYLQLFVVLRFILLVCVTCIVQSVSIQIVCV